MYDIIEGLKYLHESPIGYHGCLRSSNCLIDSRYVVKLMGFSPKSSKNWWNLNDLPNYKESLERQLTMAPELINMITSADKEVRDMKKCDIYSFSILCQEVICRTTPFHHREMNLNLFDVVESILENNLRPDLVKFWDDNCPKTYKRLITMMWSSNASLRPPMNFISNEYITMIGMCEVGSVVDTLMNRLSAYACQLEEMVEERTRDLLVEKTRSDELLAHSENLLYQMLPPQVAQDLRCGKAVKAQFFDSVTIYLSDIVGFTKICSSLEPIQIVELLNNLYSLMDTIIADYNVYKVETIGDAYMLVSGLLLNDDHSKEIALTSLNLVDAVTSITVPPDDKPLNIRIGINSGSICAGVVGIKMPRYCLFGDTVNMASRMESTGKPQMIHLSLQTKQLLDPFKQFDIVSRGVIDIKGKESAETFWLRGQIEGSKK